MDCVCTGEGEVEKYLQSLTFRLIQKIRTCPSVAPLGLEPGQSAGGPGRRGLCIPLGLWRSQIALNENLRAPNRKRKRRWPGCSQRSRTLRGTREAARGRGRTAELNAPVPVSPSIAQTRRVSTLASRAALAEGPPGAWWGLDRSGRGLLCGALS